ATRPSSEESGAQRQSGGDRRSFYAAKEAGFAVWGGRRAPGGLNKGGGAGAERQAFKATVEQALVEPEEDLRDVELAIRQGAGDNGADDNVVLAVTLNAVGQLQALLGRDGTRDSYRRALTLLPSFIEPGINLAALYVNKNTSLDQNWATRAERL